MSKPVINDMEHARNMLQQKWEYYKKLWFSELSDPQYDEDGNEVPSAYPTKQQIVQALSAMGLQIPHSPDAPMKPIQRRQAQDAEY